MNIQDLVLAGGGHAQLAVLTALARQRLPDVAVTLVTPASRQVYSGMLPGWIAGHYVREQCEIDLQALALAAKVRFVQGAIDVIDADRRCVTLAGGGELPYDLLSLDVGSETDVSRLDLPDGRVMPVRPLGDFIDRWPAVLEVGAEGEGAPGQWRLAVVGDGAAAVEIALAARFAFDRAGRAGTVGLVTGGKGILPGFARGVRKRIERVVQASRLEVLAGPAVTSEQGLLLPDGTAVMADWVIAATGALAPRWLRRGGPLLDAGGFVVVNAQHRSVSHPTIFAAGDVCARQDVTMARSGVHAVHAGPVLAHNLLATMAGKPLRVYQPRRHSLYLMATGPRRAVVSWGAISAQGRWAWRWKDHIDQGFVDRHKEA